MDWIEESNLLNKEVGCNTCCPNPQKIVLGINTIWDTDRWMCNLGVSEEDAKSHTKSQGVCIEVVCPNCGNKKNIIISNVYKKKSISCICEDKGISYPEKFIIGVLKQLELDFIYQATNKNFTWCDNKRYDFYIPKYNMIIETQGEQHYKECPNFKISLEEVVKNDKLKKELALSNRIEYYIVIDCRYSNLEYIKNNILSSDLTNLFDLSVIDWLKCEEFALSNLVKEVCDYWKTHKEINKEFVTLRKMSEEFGLHEETIRVYLKKGAKLKWCGYIAGENAITLGNVVVEDMFGRFVGEYKNINYIEKNSKSIFGVKLYGGCIKKVIDGRYKQHKGYIFKLKNGGSINE